MRIHLPAHRLRESHRDAADSPRPGDHVQRRRTGGDASDAVGADDKVSKGVGCPARQSALPPEMFRALSDAGIKMRMPAKSRFPCS
jgi:hypothetical protein